MNKTETRYAELLKADPNVHQFWFEPFSLRISHPEKGQPARFAADFLVVMIDGTTYFDDVKSGGMDDNAALVRIKACAQLFPLWVFRIVKPKRVRDGGGFERNEV